MNRKRKSPWIERATESSFASPREVDKPTYEIVGPVERYDQRDHPTARAYMKPHSPEYEDYYLRHPERLEWDEQCRRLKSQNKRKIWEKDPVNVQFRTALFYARECLGLPVIVEGTLDSRNEGWKDRRVEVDPQEMVQKIKSFGLYLGADKIRITELNQNWVYTHFAHPYTPETYGSPVRLDYKYIICIAIRQNPFMTANGIGNAMETEVGWKYAYASLLSVIIAHFIRSLGWPARALPPENSPYIMPPVFVDAGMGEFGRCGFVVSKEFGNNFRPGAVATDIPLSIDKPVDFGLQDFCEKCKVCADECPSGAIPRGEKVIVRGIRRWHIDNEKCRRFRDSIGGSCGVCQAVCPWNHTNNWLHNSIRELSEKIPLSRSPMLIAHNLIYGKFKKGPCPDWMMTKGTKAD